MKRWLIRCAARLLRPVIAEAMKPPPFDAEESRRLARALVNELKEAGVFLPRSSALNEGDR